MGAQERLTDALGRLRRLSVLELLTSLHSVIVMTIVELTVRWVPLPRLSRAFGVPLRLGPDKPGYDGNPPGDLDARTLRQLACTHRVAAVWPFSDGPCLRRAITAGHLIRRLLPELRMGVVGDTDNVVAHAWLEIDGQPLESVEHLRPFGDISGPVDR